MHGSQMSVVIFVSEVGGHHRKSGEASSLPAVSRLFLLAVAFSCCPPCCLPQPTLSRKVGGDGEGSGMDGGRKGGAIISGLASI